MTRLGRLARGAAARLPLPISEAQFQQQVTDLAELRGWGWVHFRPARRADDSWYTPVEGPLGKGWVDLLLVRGDRLIFAELKRGGAKVTAAQERVHQVLNGLINYRPDGTSAIEVFVWGPDDWLDIESELR